LGEGDAGEIFDRAPRERLLPDSVGGVDLVGAVAGNRRARVARDAEDVDFPPGRVEAHGDQRVGPADGIDDRRILVADRPVESHHEDVGPSRDAERPSERRPGGLRAQRRDHNRGREHRGEPDDGAAERDGRGARPARAPV
jgi:hypothetical protein